MNKDRDLRCPVRSGQALGVLRSRDAVQQQLLDPLRVFTCGPGTPVVLKLKLCCNHGR